MSWARLDDSFIDHPKMVGLRLELVGLWAKALGYCGRHLTDGAIRRALLPQLTGLSLSRAVKLAGELVKAGLWENVGSDYLVHDYLVWNPSRRQVLEERERRSLAGRAAARARWQQPSDLQSGSACDPHAIRKAARIEVATEVPCTRPGPSREDDPGAPSREVKRSAVASEEPGFGSFWAAYPRKVKRPRALKIWRALKPSEALQAEMLRALEAQRRSPQWTREGGQFIPYPATWLNDRGWEDQFDVPTTDSGHHYPVSWSCPVCGEVHRTARSEKGRCPNQGGRVDAPR